MVLLIVGGSMLWYSGWAWASDISRAGHGPKNMSYGLQMADFFCTPRVADFGFRVADW